MAGWGSMESSSEKFETKVPKSDYAVDPRKTPEWYLHHAEECSVKTQNMISSGGSNMSLKFNYEQCEYLVGKLSSALQKARSFLRLFRARCGDEDMTEHLDIFKFLLSLAFEVETFIRDCCKDAWIQAAFTLANMSEHVILLGFNLEVCRVVFPSNDDEWKATRTRTSDEVAALSKVEAARISEAEVETVKTRAVLDKKTLLEDLEHAKMSPSDKLSDNDLQLATFLLEKLNRGISLLAPGSDNGESTSNVGGVSQILNDLEQMESLGKGSSAYVHKAILFGAQVAKKTFIGPDHPDFLKEVSVLEPLSHANVMSLFCHGKNNHKCRCSIIMELMDRDLTSFLEQRLTGDGTPPFTIFEALDLMFQIAFGMKYLCENGVAHRDLKSGNILVKSHVEQRKLNIEYVHAKVADFGLSKTKQKSRTYSEQEPNTGTVRWMAPELMPRGVGRFEWIWSWLGNRSQYFPFKRDVYSFAMVCYEILTGNVPFRTTSKLEDVRKQVLAGHRPQLLSDQCPNELKTLIEKCWDGKPSIRPSFAEICAELKYLKCYFLTSTVQDMLKIKELNHNHARGYYADAGFESKHEHSVFLSHSGAQKDFVGQLCVDLESVDLESTDFRAFSGNFRSSLPVGASFFAGIFEAISECRVGVVVLSEEYFTSKWTMLELTTMVRYSKQNPSYIILPVFLGISPTELNDPENHKRWLLKWAEWEKRDNRHNLKEWMAAVGEVCRINGIILHNAISLVQLRAEIVRAIYKLLAPETEWDDSHADPRTGGADEHSDREFRKARPILKRTIDRWNEDKSQVMLVMLLLCGLLFSFFYQYL